MKKFLPMKCSALIQNGGFTVRSILSILVSRRLRVSRILWWLDSDGVCMLGV